jgi:hypothetical protein
MFDFEESKLLRYQELEFKFKICWTDLITGRKKGGIFFVLISTIQDLQCPRIGLASGVKLF